MPVSARGPAHEVGPVGEERQAVHLPDIIRSVIGVDRVVPLPGVFVDLARQVGDIIGIVPLPAAHRIGAAQAIDHVIAIVAGEYIGAGAAGCVDVRRSGQGQVFDVGSGKRVSDA